MNLPTCRAQPKCHPITVGALIAGALVGGCHFSSPPDPNAISSMGPEKRALHFRQDIQATADDLDQRYISKQITDAQRDQLLAQRAKELLAQGDPAHSSPADAWIYADLYITEQRYDLAIPLLKRAVQYATEVKDDDRRVNDSFRLARALAETGQIEPALTLAQQVIASQPKDPGPVLPSVLLELTPITKGKGHDLQLAKLLEEAIHEHLRMKVDPNTDAGRAFLLAKPFHINHAWSTIVKLLEDAGQPGQAAAARAKWKAMLDSTANLTAPPGTIQA